MTIEIRSQSNARFNISPAYVESGRAIQSGSKRDTPRFFQLYLETKEI